MATVVMPLPDIGFDVTEVAVPWRLLREAGHDVHFATERGTPAAADPLLLSGVVFGQLGAAPEPARWYADMVRADAFRRPLRWADVHAGDLDGLVLAGGHASGMRQYLEAVEVRRIAAEAWAAAKPLGAICHGVVVLARTPDGTTGRSVLHEARTTCLPRYMERTAFWTTAWRRGRYYRTYPTYVEDEVRGALADPTRQFERGPIELVRRGTATDDRAAFVVVDGPYVSARWPGDAYRFARAVAVRLAGEPESARAAPAP